MHFNLIDYHLHSFVCPIQNVLQQGLIDATVQHYWHWALLIFLATLKFGGCIITIWDPLLHGCKYSSELNKLPHAADQ